jgi:hypothetical protein
VPVTAWVRSLLDEGTGPAVWILEEDVPDEDLDGREIAWIAAARGWGSNLLNIAAGGAGSLGRSR